MSEELFFKIEAYLKGELSPEDTSAFDAELAADPNLAAQVDAQKTERKIVELLIEDDLRASVKDWLKEEAPTSDEKTPVPKIVSLKQNWWIWGAVAAAFLLFVWFVFLKQGSNGDTLPPEQNMVEDKPLTPPPQEEQPQVEQPGKKPNTPNENPAPNKNKYIALVQDYSENPVFAGEDIRSGEPGELSFEAALSLINEKKYQKAIDSLRQIQPNEKRFEDAQYNIGCIYFLQKKYEEALPFLKNSSENANYLYSPNARWYRILSLLAKENKKDVEAQLAILIKDKDGDFYIKATALKKQLDSIQ